MDQPSAQQPIRVLIVDDHPIYSDGLATMLGSYAANIDVIGRAADGRQAVDMVEWCAPDVVLMDIKMPSMNGIEATQEIKRRFPDIKVLALSAYDDESYVLQMIKAGASGYMLKDADHTTIISGILAVHRGQARLHPRLAMTLMEALAESPGSLERHSHDGLTPREVEVVKLLGQGSSTREIAAKLWISERTVENHVHSIYRKLNLSDRAQVALYAVRKGLIANDGTAIDGA